MNKGGITSTHLIVRIVIIIIILLILLFVSLGIIKFVPKVFSYISSLNSNLVNLPKDNTASSTNIISQNITTSSTTPENLSVVFTTSSINSKGLGTVIFNVTNTRGKNSGPWKFSAILPRSNKETLFDSGYQTNIPPGKTSVMKFNFNNAKSGTITINLNGKTFTTKIN